MVVQMGRDEGCHFLFPQGSSRKRPFLPSDIIPIESAYSLGPGGACCFQTTNAVNVKYKRVPVWPWICDRLLQIDGDVVAVRQRKRGEAQDFQSIEFKLFSGVAFTRLSISDRHKIIDATSCSGYRPKTGRQKPMTLANQRLVSSGLDH